MRRALPTLALAACVLVPSALFLGRYVVGGTGVAPAGSDTPQHVWRSEVVAALGLDALPPFEGEAQALNANADRPGLPLLLAVASSVTGADARDLAYVLPAVVAAAIALAAAALAGAIPGVPWWGIGLVGVATGASVQVAMTANGYLDQLLVEPLLLGGAAAALRAADGGPGRALGGTMLVAAWLVHWQFALLVTGLLGVLAIACLPGSIRQRREGRPFAATPAGRVGATVGGGAAVGVAALVLGTPGVPRWPSGLVRASVERHLGDQVALYRLPAAAGAAAAGAAFLAAPGGAPGRRRGAWLLVPWALAPAGAWLLYAAGRTVPVQRTLSFALAIPLLGAVAAVSLIVWGRRRLGPAAGGAAAVLAGVALVASVSFGWDVWRSREPWSPDRRLAEFAALGGYIADAGRPAIVVVDKHGGRLGGASEHFGTVPVMRRIRAVLPPRRALETTVYLGDPARLLGGRPTLHPEVPGYDAISRETWAAVRPLLRRDPLILILRSQFLGFDETVRDHPEWQGSPWVAVVSGPPIPPSFGRPPPVDRPTLASLVVRWGAMLGLLAVAGAGWAGRLGGGSGALRQAMAPATGIAALVVAGLIAEHLGVRVGHAGGVLVAIGVAFAGAVAAATRPPGDPSASRERRADRP